MTGNFARGAGQRLVPEHDAGHGEPIQAGPGDARRRQRIMIALHPDKPGKPRDAGEQGKIGRGQPPACLAIVKTVADGHQGLRRMARHQGGQPVQGDPAVERRHQLSAARTGAALLEMQIGDRHQRQPRPY